MSGSGRRSSCYVTEQQHLRRKSAYDSNHRRRINQYDVYDNHQWSGVFHFSDDFGDLWPYPEYQSYSDSCFAGISSLKPEHRRWRLVLDRNANTQRSSPPERSGGFLEQQ